MRRAKRKARRQAGAPPITGRDEAVLGLKGFAANFLLRQPEVRERLARAATYRNTLTTAAGRFAYWEALLRLEDDVELVDATQLDRLLHEWDRVEQRLDSGWPVVAASGITGRIGRDSTMTPDAVRLVVRSIALRPQARAMLNAERAGGYRGTRQRGHEHQQAEHAHGASRADALAAAEVNRREGWTDKYGVKAATVKTYRERLRSILRDAEGDPAVHHSHKNSHNGASQVLDSAC